MKSDLAVQLKAALFFLVKKKPLRVKTELTEQTKAGFTLNPAGGTAVHHWLHAEEGRRAGRWRVE